MPVARVQIGKAFSFAPNKKYNLDYSNLNNNDIARIIASMGMNRPDFQQYYRNQKQKFKNKGLYDEFHTAYLVRKWVEDKRRELKLKLILSVGMHRPDFKNYYRKRRAFFQKYGLGDQFDAAYRARQEIESKNNKKKIYQGWLKELKTNQHKTWWHRSFS
jgi:hypothetical protein